MLREYQRQAVEGLWSALCHQQGHHLIVAPTAAGKSIIAAELCRRIWSMGGRSLVICPKYELITQNAAQLRKLMPNVSVGIYSAGLKAREVNHDVIVCGIHSVFERAHEFGERQLGIVDEAHLVSNKSEGMYRRFMEDCEKYNQEIRFGGLTATPFRMGQGLLIDGKQSIWSGIAYRIEVRDLLEHDPPYLCRLVAPEKPITKGLLDEGNVGMRNAKFIEKEHEGEALLKVRGACEAIVQHTADRHTVLVFCVTVAHAEAVVRELRLLVGDHNVDMIDGTTPKLFRSGILKRFGDFGVNKLKYLVNVDTLTTGVDVPCIDCIAILRMITSPGLLAQICGRGFRLSPHKKDCLLLDFGSNIRRHGQLDNPDFGHERTFKEPQLDGEKGTKLEDAPPTPCTHCGCFVSANAVRCPVCGLVRNSEFKARHETEADTDSPIYGTDAQDYSVIETDVKLHLAKSGVETVMLTYTCDAGRTVREWVCLDHPEQTRAHRIAVSWWIEHSSAPVPHSAAYAVQLFWGGAVRIPGRIRVVRDGKYDRIVSREFFEDRPTTWMTPENVDDVANLFKDVPF